MRAAKRRESSPSAGRSGAPNVTVVCRRLGCLAPCAGCRPVPSMCMGTTGTSQRSDEVRGAAAERLAPPVGGAAPFGEDDHAPPVGEQFGRVVGRPAARPSPLDRDGVEREGRRRAGDPVAEEVVGRGHHEHLVAPRLRDRREHQRRVEVAVVVGGEDHRPVDRSRSAQPVEAARPRGRPAAARSAAAGPRAATAPGGAGGGRRAHSVS